MKFLMLSQGTCHVGDLFPETFHQAGHKQHFLTSLLKGKSLPALSIIPSTCHFSFLVLKFLKIRHTAYAGKFDS